ncbi:hypothetical protein MXD61_06885 [Frankia sp. AgPm24]|uniref:hypothetical protein n=1 Tax=Frankia sp. AgPm24 TaxID=631128 RepID=UPI0020105000|nr:hypothetical protein [Frankia sp. AgPm24]MCK9921616.1 hypothetical protein [Frankia sp. AgPm24]
MDRTVEYLAAAAHEIASWWDELYADRIPGTPRRWAERSGSTPAPGLTRVSALAPAHDCGTPWSWAPDSTPAHPRPYCPRCAGSTGPGESPAPVRLDVVDTIPLITRTVLALEDTVRRTLGDGPADRAPARLDARGLVWPTPALRTAVWPGRPGPLVPLAARYLARQADRIAGHDQLVDVALDELRYARGRLRAAVGTAEQIRVLAAACPICHTMGLRAYHQREIIACTNPACRCQTEGCWCHRGGHHLWRYNPDPRHDEWAWLARTLDEDLAAWLTDAA